MTSPALLDRLQYLAQLQTRAAGAVELQPLQPHQTPPPQPWDGWLIEAGRGAGKTAAIAQYVTDHINGPPCLPGNMPHKMVLVAPTIGDAVESAARHPICLKSLTPSGKLRQQVGGTIFSWPNGSEMKLLGVHTQDDVERLRAAGNNCLAWLEELATWRYLEDGFAQLQFGLRIGPRPHWVGSSTPKRRPPYRKVRDGKRVVLSHAETSDNPYLNEDRKAALYDLYDGTSLGAQELGGRLLDEVEGAFWTYAMIDQDRLRVVPNTLDRVVVGVDPPGGATEAGIVVAARVNDCPCGGARMPHAVVLADYSTAGSPDKWGRRAVQAFTDTTADRIVGEVNYGGDMVRHVIRTVDGSVPYADVRATRGKAIRAEPIAALYEQHRIHHVGVFPQLEEEQTAWTPDETWSPNRMDALVWALTELEIAKPPRRWAAV